MAYTIISRAEAKAQGLKRYCDGKPCRNGHVDQRTVSYGECLSCQKAKVLRWRDANRDKWKASNKASKTARQKLYSDRQRADYAANPEKYKAAWARYYARKRDWHIERATLSGRKRRAQKKGSGGTHTAADLREILASQKHRCSYCSADLRKTKKHLDHIMPLALGGSNDRGNLQYLCGTCNLSKGAKDPIAFARQRGILVVRV
jgi:5-methylcytosine-specific restriction endonuclease McrA